MPSWDVKINGVEYNFGQQGGLALGKAMMEPSPALQVGTITVPGFHHGPGQIIGRDPAAYRRATKVDTSRKGLLVPAGQTNVRHTTADAAFDGGIHGAGWCQVNDKVFLITPVKIYSLNHAANTFSVVYTNAASIYFTGSWTRWRGRIIFGRETTPAASIGGDSTARYAMDTTALYYDIATDAFASVAGTTYSASFLTSKDNTIWWIQNRGRFGAPYLYWADDSNSNYGAFTVYGPFSIETGGYSTWLHLNGQHILVFKRDGSIIGVDQSKIWMTYSPDREPIEDDQFGHGVSQYQSVLVAPSKAGAVIFNPANLGMDTLEPSRVQGYVAVADDNFIGKTTALTVRGSELYAFGRCPNGAALYTGTRFGEEGFFFSSDYGVYAVPDTVSAPGAQAFTLRGASGGSKVRAIAGADQRTLRKIVASTTFDETPMAATVYHHESTGVDHHHMFVAHWIEANDKLKIYQIDLAQPGYTTGPSTVSAGKLITSKLFGEARGITQLPLQVRGYANIVTSPLTVSLGIEEASPVVVGTVSSTGLFVLRPQVPAALLGQAGRHFTLQFDTPADAKFRLEAPVYLDVMYAKTGGADADHLTINISVGDVVNNLGTAKQSLSPHNYWETLSDLQNTSVQVQFAWGGIWTVWIEDVRIKQLLPELVTQQAPGLYIVSLDCRRLQ